MAAGLGSNGAPLTAMAVLEPQFTASGALEVVLATEDGNVLGDNVLLLCCNSRYHARETYRTAQTVLVQT